MFDVLFFELLFFPPKNDGLSDCTVIRASVPKLNLDDVFEQKNQIAKAVEDELEKVLHDFIRLVCSAIQMARNDDYCTHLPLYDM